MKLVVDAPAKINLFLDIVGKLDNGYHSLAMIMQSIGLSDIITVETTDKKEIIIECSEKSLPNDKSNIAYKAAEKFFEYSGVSCGVVIKIEKRIPFAAGLAGGSADAAAVIVALNEIFKTGYSERELCDIGLKVGSDVPFCIVGGTCLAQNTGGVLSKLKPLNSCYIVIVKPDQSVSTADAYEHSDKTYIRHLDLMRMLDCAEKGDFEGICQYAGNVFEQVVEVCDRIDIKAVMKNNGASLYQMSGSGPSVFGLFESEDNAAKCANELAKKYKNVFVVPPVDSGATIISKE